MATVEKHINDIEEQDAEKERVNGEFVEAEQGTSTPFDDDSEGGDS